jgi:ferredoxin
LKKTVLTEKRAMRGIMDRYRKGRIGSPPEVDSPTYEIVDTVERYDQRDHANARKLLVPGSDEYEDYYNRRPDLKEWDDKNRERQAGHKIESCRVDPVGSQIVPAAFYGRRVLGMPDVVEGKIAVRQRLDTGKADVNPQGMARMIKSFAGYFGAGRVRITRLNPDWVYTHYAAPYTLEPYGKPVELDYKYIICMAFPQNLNMMANGDGVAAHLEVGWMYAYTSLVSVIIAQHIRSLGWRTKALPAENSPLLIVPTFVDAGIGEQGRTCHVVTKEFGNNFRPGAIATDMPLAIDKPVDFGLQDFCEKCKICADECPAGAIPKGDKEVVRGARVWHFNGDKCRRYQDYKGISCGICQYVCPWSFPNKWYHNIVRELNQRSAVMRTLAIKGHHMVYGKYRRGPQPEWIMRTREALSKEGMGNKTIGTQVKKTDP